MSKPKTLYETITEAVADLTAHGFDSQRRIDGWMERIQAAAHRSLTPPDRLDELLRETLKGLYHRLIDGGRIARLHPGVSAFTLREVKPKLRAELQRRIMASADLITLNREQSIAKTLQRFQGWATSVPAGGSRVQDKREVKYDIGKSLKQLPFEERRVIIDQGHKLTASINDVIAQDGGAIAMRWHSQWQELNYNFRKDHKARDEKVYLIRDSWAHKKGFVKPGPAGYLDGITQPAEEPFCFPGETLIPFAEDIGAAYRRWYSGAVCTIRTESGRDLTGTPNHPILTPHGWAAIGDLKEGDQVVEMADQIGQLAEQDQHGAVASIADVFAALLLVGTPEKRGGQLEQFHGDGTEGDVDIIRADRPLSVGMDAGRSERGDQLGLAMADGGGTGGGLALLRGGALLSAAQGGLGSLCEGAAALGALPLHADTVGIGTATQRDAKPDQMGANAGGGEPQAPGDGQRAFPGGIGADHRGVVGDQPVASPPVGFDAMGAQAVPQGDVVDAEFVRDLRDGLPFATQASRVVKVDRNFWSGHVFNLETGPGFYVAAGIITHNCRCFGSYIYSVKKLPEDMVTEKGREAMAAARAKVQAA